MIATILLYIFATIGVLNTITAIIFLIYLAIDINNYKEWEYVEGYGFRREGNSNSYQNVERERNEGEVSDNNQNNSGQCET